MANKFVFPVNDPNEIALIRAVRDGSKPITEIRNIVGRRKADAAISSLGKISLQVKLYCQDYLRNPIKADIEFIKTYCNMHNGRNKTLYSINGNYEVQEISNELLFLTVSLEALLPDKLLQQSQNQDLATP